MNQAKPKIRLYVPEPFSAGASLALSENQSHYLAHVMRSSEGDAIAVFNGSDGQWRAEIASIGKKSVRLQLKQAMAAQKNSPDLWLAFAPIKNKLDSVVEKAVELGVAKLLPVYTRHTVVKSVNMEKLFAYAIEAAEQSGRHEVPAIEECKDLSTLLGNWPQDRTLLYGDESGHCAPFKTLLTALPRGKYTVLVGPEGGFSAEEHRMLKSVPFVKSFCMGPRILRADTAAIAALACVQSWLGDWDEMPNFEETI